MRISNFKIINYKSFYSTEVLTLTSGFNIVVGQNNVGKTALVQALSLDFKNNPHRSLKTLPQSYSSLQNPYSECRVYLELPPKQIKSFINQMGIFYVPSKKGESPQNTFERFINALCDEQHLMCIFRGDGSPFSMSLENFEDGEAHNSIYVTTELETGNLIWTGQVGSFAPQSTYGPILGRILASKLYIFKAERLNIGECRVGSNPILASNAANLAEVLNLLQSSNVSRFKRFNQLVSVIFPQIKQITIPPINNETVKILIWTIDPDTERADLAVPLSESGTGIGQVLSILYVVLTSDEPRIIIIDEPQSFLHPGAVRKLIEILKSYSQHQFIITTHSPTVVTATNPQTLFLIRSEESESIVEPINVLETNEIRRFLLEIGARLSDVFGADNILWVEGRTEELCFPLLVENILKQSLMGTQIIGVQHTGDFEGKRSKTVFELYERLSRGRGLLPPAIGFIFDRENRTQQERDDLIRQSDGKIKFLNRKMYENYLLNPHAISFVLSQSDSSKEREITLQDVEQWIKDNGCNRRYIDTGKSPITSDHPQWLENVHAARVLEDIFSNLSDNRVTFDKVEHGVLLTEWIISNAQSDLSEVSELIKTFG